MDLETSNQRPTAAAMDWETYHTPQEIFDWMDELAVNYPGVVSLEILGESYEKRPMKLLKISKKSVLEITMDLLIVPLTDCILGKPSIFRWSKHSRSRMDCRSYCNLSHQCAFDLEWSRSSRPRQQHRLVLCACLKSRWFGVHED